MIRSSLLPYLLSLAAKLAPPATPPTTTTFLLGADPDMLCTRTIRLREAGESPDFLAVARRTEASYKLHLSCALGIRRSHQKHWTWSGTHKHNISSTQNISLLASHLGPTHALLQGLPAGSQGTTARAFDWRQHTVCDHNSDKLPCPPIGAPKSTRLQATRRAAGSTGQAFSDAAAGTQHHC